MELCNQINRGPFVPKLGLSCSDKICGLASRPHLFDGSALYTDSFDGNNERQVGLHDSQKPVSTPAPARWTMNSLSSAASTSRDSGAALRPAYRKCHYELAYMPEICDLSQVSLACYIGFGYATLACRRHEAKATIRIVQSDQDTPVPFCISNLHTAEITTKGLPFLLCLSIARKPLHFRLSSALCNSSEVIAVRTQVHTKIILLRIYTRLSGAATPTST